MPDELSGPGRLTNYFQPMWSNYFLKKEVMPPLYWHGLLRYLFNTVLMPAVRIKILYTIYYGRLLSNMYYI